MVASAGTTNLSDLPYELKEKIAFSCDYWAYQKLRTCDSVFHSFPSCKIVDFGEFQSLLKGLRLEKWEFGSDYDEYEENFWWRMERIHDPKVAESQHRIKLDLSCITQEQYLYVCRNELAHEVCRIVSAVLLNPHNFAHIDLTACNHSESNRKRFYYSLGFVILSGEVDLLSDLLQVEGIDPAFGGNAGILMASKNGNAESVRLLLGDARVDPSVENNHSIRFASENGYAGVVQLLLQDARVDPAVNNNQAIIMASKKGRVEVVQLLLGDARVDPSTNYNQAIRLASYYGYAVVVQLLLQDARVDPSVDNNQAIRKAGNVEVAQLLLQDARVDQSFRRL